MTDRLQDRLCAYLAGATGEGVSIAGMRRLAGGVSRETWAFDLIRAGKEEGQPLVLRMDTPRPFIEGSRGSEFSVIRWAGTREVPVPQVLWCEDDPEVLGGAFFIMSRIEGESRTQRLHRDARFARARERLLPQAAAALAAIHRMTPDEAPQGVDIPLRKPAQDVEDLTTLYRRWAMDPHPVLELALRWLASHLPEHHVLTLVHGDFRPGNLLFDEEGLCAVLDWELAQFGDPRMDLAWMCLRSWRGGAPGKDEGLLEAGGLATRRDWLDAYAKSGGISIAGEDWHFWDVFAHARWAVVTVMEAGGFLEGNSNIELAGLGRRTAEVEWDLLTLLEKEG